MFVAKSELVGMSVGLRQYHDPTFFAGLEPHIMAAAREAARTDAQSYRNFFVGACGAVLLRDAKKVTFVTSANNSPYKGAPKRCAEMGVVRQADELARTRRDAAAILAMYIAGPNDAGLIKEVTGLATPTLHSCADCQNLMQAHVATPDNMRLVTFGVGDDGALPERHTLGSMLKLYRNVAPPPISSQLLATAGYARGVPSGG